MENPGFPLIRAAIVFYAEAALFRFIDMSSIDVEIKSFRQYNMNMFFQRNIPFKKSFFILSLALFCSSVFPVSLTDRIQNLIEKGSPKEMENAFRRYNYLSQTTLGKDKDSLIMEAVENDRGTDFIKILVKGGVNLKCKNRNRQTALHYVCLYSDDNPEVFTYVLKKWGRKNAVSRGLLSKDRNGFTAYEYALENLGSGMISELENYLDPLKSVPVREKFNSEHGTGEVLEESSGSKAASDENAPEKSAGIRKADLKNESIQNAERKTDDEQIKSSEPEKLAEKGYARSSEKSNVLENTMTSGLSDVEDVGNGGSEDSGLAAKNEIESGIESENILAENEERGARTSIDIERRQRELSSISESISSFGNERSFLFDYEPDSFSAEPERTQENKVQLAEIKNPNSRDFNGRTLLMKAVKDGNDWEIRSLLKSGADVNLSDNEGWTALMYAIRYQNNFEITKLLLENGADINARNRYGSSPLLLASAYSGNPEILGLLLENFSGNQNDVFKAFVFSITAGGSSSSAQIAKLKVFVDRGISINRFYEGKTPLMYAAEYASSTEIIKFLLDNGALSSVRDSSGKRAFDYAKANSRLERDEVYWSLNTK